MNVERIWSPEQSEVFTWFAYSTVNGIPVKNLVVIALAGTGKTTTIVEGINRAPEASILACAFNKSIEVELTKRITNPNAKAKTLHALGYACVLRFWKVKPQFDSHRADSLSKAACEKDRNVPLSTLKLISKLHTKGREMAPHATEVGDLTDIAIEFECEPSAQDAAEGFDLEFIESRALAAMELAAKERPVDGIIDGSDMIFLPIRNGWLRPAYDLVVVDEAQDMTKSQLEIALGVCRGRICLVGDPNQAIYGFRGADSGSLGRLKAELSAAELGLTVTYRCGQAIVTEAQKFVPTFTAGPSNPAGTVEGLPLQKLTESAQNGDFILSRVNAPLVSVAMSLLRNGKRARVAGRDIGKNLSTIVRKLATGAGASSVPAFIERLNRWADKEIARITPQLKNERTKNAAEAKIELVQDQEAMLTELAEGAVSVRDVQSRIDDLFVDNGEGMKGIILCSSVHKAKGLEADRVFVLRNTLRGDDQEELNIQYVAITRAKQTLTWVTK